MIYSPGFPKDKTAIPLALHACEKGSLPPPASEGIVNISAATLGAGALSLPRAMPGIPGFWLDAASAL